MNWLPNLKNVSCINGLSQRSQYVKIPNGVGGGGGGGGGGGVPGGGRKSKLESCVENANWDPRFKPTTALDAKIKKMIMKKITEKPILISQLVRHAMKWAANGVLPSMLKACVKQGAGMRQVINNCPM